MKKLAFVIATAAVAVSLTGCMTEKSRRIIDGEDTEVTAQINEDDIRIFVSKTIQDIDKASIRYAKPNARRVINVKPVIVDTNARGRQAGYLAESITACFQEELMNGDKFIVYDEAMAINTDTAPVLPEFVMVSKLRDQEVRRDNGNIYKEYALMIKLIDVKTHLQFWQKRVPIRKAVDKANAL